MSSNLIVKTTGLALHLLAPYIKEGDTVVDATIGNGYDTLFLAKEVGADRGVGKVYGFDIQETALESTKELLRRYGIKSKIWGKTLKNQMKGASTYMDRDIESNAEVILIQDSHHRMNMYDIQDVGAVIFNLGYMPGQDKTVTTDCKSTMTAVKSALEMIKPNGLVMIVMYSGHEAGAEEKIELLDFAKALDAKTYHVAFTEMINQPASAPSILMITKKI